jgi:hypothetical protein
VAVQRRCWEKERCEACIGLPVACQGVPGVHPECVPSCWGALGPSWDTSEGYCKCRCRGTWHGYGTALYVALRASPETLARLQARPAVWSRLEELVERHGLVKGQPV